MGFRWGFVGALLGLSLGHSLGHSLGLLWGCCRGFVGAFVRAFVGSAASLVSRSLGEPWLGARPIGHRPIGEPSTGRGHRCMRGCESVRTRRTQQKLAGTWSGLRLGRLGRNCRRRVQLDATSWLALCGRVRRSPTVVTFARRIPADSEAALRAGRALCGMRWPACFEARFGWPRRAQCKPNASPR